MSDDKKKETNHQWINGVTVTPAKENYTPTGKKKGDFRMVMKTKQGDYYISVTAWEENADTALLLTTPGTPVAVYGTVKSDEYKGKTYYNCDAKHLRIPSNLLFNALRAAAPAAPAADTPQPPPTGEEAEEDIPF